MYFHEFFFREIKVAISEFNPMYFHKFFSREIKTLQVIFLRYFIAFFGVTHRECSSCWVWERIVKKWWLFVVKMHGYDFSGLFFKLPHLQPAFLIPQLIPVSDGAVVQQCLHVVGPVSVAQANKVWIRQVILPQSKVGRRNTRDEFDNWHEFAPAKFPKNIAKEST